MPSLLERFGQWLSRRVPSVSVRKYSGAGVSRFSLGFGGGNTSADAELSQSLALLRSRSRQLMRDSAYARRVRTIVTQNVLGSGVGLQAQVINTRGEQAKLVNDAIESAWRQWCKADTCHTGGALHFSDLERVALAEVVTAGEVILRIHRRPFGGGQIPIALELIESERLVDELQSVLPQGAQNVRMGVEVDQFGRAVAYWIRQQHPGDTRWTAVRQQKVERVPAEDILHLRIIHRWPQTRGEPWLHTVLRKLDDMSEYSAAELQAAKASAFYFGTVETPESYASPMTAEADGAVAPQIEIEPGAVQQLMPGEKLNFHSPNRPNNAIDPFIRHMLREVAAGCDVSYESLSRDYSQSNYSSSRLALLDDRDVWRVLQQWWVRSFREPFHRQWLRAAVLSRAISSIPLEAYLSDTERYEQVIWKLRGWHWVDPTKEVAAYKEAVRAGFITVSDVISQTAGGMDIEDVLATRRRELDLMGSVGLSFDTDPTAFDESGKPVAQPSSPVSDDGDDEAQQVGRVVQFGGK